MFCVQCAILRLLRCNFASSHLRLVHGSDPRFSAQCGIEGCSYSARSFLALYSHIYRRHPESGVVTRRGHCVTPQVEPERSEVSEPSRVHQPSLPELQGNQSLL